MDFLLDSTIYQAHKYQKKIDTYTVVSLSTETSVLFQVTIGDVLFKHRVMTIQKMNGLAVSLNVETFLNTGQFCLVIKPSS